MDALDELPVLPAAIYLLDRGYLDFGRLFRIHQAGAFLVTRAKSNTRCRRVYSAPVDKAAGLLCDQTVRLVNPKPSQTYPDPLRRVRYNDPETSKGLVFLTNLFYVPALTIAMRYRGRWMVEMHQSYYVPCNGFYHLQGVDFGRVSSVA